MPSTLRHRGDAADRDDRATPEHPRVDDDIREPRGIRLSAGDRDTRVLDPDDERHSQR